MIRTTGFKPSFLGRSNRRPAFYTSAYIGNFRSFEYFGRRLGSPSGFVLSSIYRGIPVSFGFPYNVKPETFRRLFLLPWKK